MHPLLKEFCGFWSCIVFFRVLGIAVFRTFSPCSRESLYSFKRQKPRSGALCGLHDTSGWELPLNFFQVIVVLSAPVGLLNPRRTAGSFRALWPDQLPTSTFHKSARKWAMCYQLAI